MSGHTPGPWLIAGGTTVYALQSAGFRHGREQFENRFGLGVSGKAPFAELEANACLIAAAPTMYAALLDCIAAFEDTTADADGRLEAAAINAAAAIAKAEGK